MPAVIQFDHVSKRFQRRLNRPRSFREMFIALLKGRQLSEAETLWAVRDVSFAIAPGETTGLIGPNGAGKSTAFKLISRIFAPTSGQITVTGRVAALLELGTGFHPELSGRENVYLSGALIGMGRAEMQRKFDAIVDFSELPDFIDEPVKHYSSGMFARLAFAVSIHLDPEILLVDEVLAVGDQAFQLKCLDRIASLQREGVTICMVTHSADVVRTMCTRALWFDHGRLVADGTAEAVVRQYLDRAAAAEANRLAEAGNVPQQRWGSGGIVITKVSLLNARGDEQTIFETGQSLIVNIAYSARETVPAPVFGLAIHRQDGVHVCGPNTAFGDFHLPTLKGEGAIAYTIPDLTLLEGAYQISVAVVNETDTETFDYQDRVCSFRVLNRGEVRQERYGLVTLRGIWAHSGV